MKKETRTSIQWDHDSQPRYVIVTQWARDWELPDVQSLLGFYGDIMGYNVELISVGGAIYGQRWDNYVLYDCSPYSFFETEMEQRWWDHFFSKFTNRGRH